jgi:AAA family ATP:ADP antiporter
MTRPTDPAARAAMITAAAMIAQQVASRATRDALFLSRFGVARLPAALIAAAVCSILLAALFARALSARGPARVVPAAFAASAALTLIEWALAARAPGVIAVAVFLHVSAFGTALASAFWSQVTEAFDPRTARRRMGTIGAAGTLGGVAGGLVAERFGARFDVISILPVLAALHVACAVAARGLVPLAQPAAPADAAPQRSALRVFRETPLLRNIAWLTVTVTVAVVLLDVVFKARVTAAYPRGRDLMRMLSAFYAGIALLTFLAQATCGRWCLERAGLARTTALLPAGVAIGGAGALLVPGVASVAIGRAIEAVVRSSVFRSGYELLFTPLAPHDRRATKTLVDVGFDRAGDALGGGAAALLMLLGPERSHPAMLLASVALSIAGVALALRLHRGYVAALERGLLRGAVALDAEDVRDRTTRDTMILTLGSRGIDVTALRAAWAAGEHRAPEAGATSGAQPGAPPASDPALERIAALQSFDGARVCAALADGPLDPAVLAHAIALLARDDAAADALRALREAAPRFTMELVRVLLDPETDFAVRRRLPRALAVCDSAGAVDGLLRGLDDVRFEVRFHSARALRRMHERNPALAFDEGRVFAAAAREALLGRELWNAGPPRVGALAALPGSALDTVVRERARQTLELVFALLALALPGEPLRLASRAIEGGDARLRGTALEYLESTLPADVKAALWPALEDRRPAGRAVRPREQALEELMRASPSIQIDVAGLRERLDEG